MSATSDQGFVPITPNPYVVGNPIRGRTMFFGRQNEFEFVRKRFHAQTLGSLLVFCGERRSGKTSILFQILEGRLGEEFVPVLIDLQSLAVSDEAEFLRKIAKEISIATALLDDPERPSVGVGGHPAGEFQGFVEAVIRELRGRKLILLFDEYELFESKIDGGVISRDVLRVLAGLMRKHPVFMVFTGSDHIEHRRRDYWEEFLAGSVYRRVSYLSHEDAIRLIREPVEGRVRYGDGVIEGICRLTAGQPFYTQAVCQNLVDRLNDLRTSEAGPGVLRDVVRDLLENAPPQMIFLWENLAREDRLVFALLAETLGSPEASSTTEELRRLIGQREYPIDLSDAQISTSLERMFEREMLLKSEGVSPEAFAFRMDLWRLWVHRKRSVWQTLGDSGVDLEAHERGRERRRRRWALASRLAAIPAAAWLVYRIFSPPPPPHEIRVADGWLSLDVIPSQAEISIQGHRVAFGSYHGQLNAGLTHEILLKATGYADSLVEVKTLPAETTLRSVTLRPLLGDLQVITDPPGAEITVDQATRGLSPVIVRGLPVTTAHTIEASLPGRPALQKSSTVEAMKTTSVQLSFAKETAELTVRTDPPGATVLLAGTSAGTTPVHLTDLTPGSKSLQLRLGGYVAVDTQVALGHEPTTVERALRPLPPGTLVIMGDLIASYWVDSVLMKENTQNSGPLTLTPGSHDVQVKLLSGEIRHKRVNVVSGARVIYDFTNDSIKQVDS